MMYNKFMAKTTLEFKKGDNKTITVAVPIADYVINSKLFFTAKPSPDNDATDATAVIDKEFGESDCEVGDTSAVYTLEFLPGDITGVSFSSNEKKKEYVGEFQYVTPAGVVQSFPANDDYIKVIIYADIRRATT